LIKHCNLIPFTFNLYLFVVLFIGSFEKIEGPAPDSHMSRPLRMHTLPRREEVVGFMQARASTADQNGFTDLPGFVGLSLSTPTIATHHWSCQRLVKLRLGACSLLSNRRQPISSISLLVLACRGRALLGHLIPHDRSFILVSVLEHVRLLLLPPVL